MGIQSDLRPACLRLAVQDIWMQMSEICIKYTKKQTKSAKLNVDLSGQDDTIYHVVIYPYRQYDDGLIRAPPFAPPAPGFGNTTDSVKKGEMEHECKTESLGTAAQ